MKNIIEKSSKEEANGSVSSQSGHPVKEAPEACRISAEHLQQAAFLAKSMSDGNRLRILLCISNGKKSVSAIVEEMALSQPLVSHHLKELKRSLLVNVEREGPFIYYELSDMRILDVIQTLTEVSTDLLSERKTF